MRTPLAILALLLAAPAAAQTASPGAQVQARERSRDDARAQAQAAARDAADLQRQLVALGAAQARGEQDVADRRERLKLLDGRERELSGRIGKNQVELARLLSALQSFRREPPPALLVSPRSARDAVRATILIQAITPELRTRGEALKAQATELQRLRRGVAETSGALFQAESESADRRGKIERLIAEKRALERRLNADADRAEAQAQRLAERARSMGELVQTLPETAGPAAVPARLTPPVQGVVIRRFGEPWPGHGRSSGWSWRALGGAVVVAPAAGRIDYAGPLKGWGGVVILQLGGELRLVLAGLDTAQAGVGQAVAAGEPLGRLPAQLGAAELYLELRKGGVPVDPASLLAGSPSPSAAARPAP